MEDLFQLTPSQKVLLLKGRGKTSQGDRGAVRVTGEGGG